MAFLQTHSFLTEDGFYTAGALRRTYPKPEKVALTQVGSLNHRAKRITGDRKSGWKSWQSSQSNAFCREPCGWLSQPRAQLSHTDFMPAICNLVTMWLDWKDPRLGKTSKSLTVCAQSSRLNPKFLPPWGSWPYHSSAVTEASKKEEVQLHQEASQEDGSRAMGGDGEASTFHRPSRRNRSHLLVGGPPEGQCLFHVLALLQQAGSLIGGQAQKSNLKKNTGRYAKKRNHTTTLRLITLGRAPRDTDKQSALRQRQYHQAF